MEFYFQEMLTVVLFGMLFINIGSLPTALHVSMSVVLSSKEFLVVTSHSEVYIGAPSSCVVS